jgi:hypothetical protein
MEREDNRNSMDRRAWNPMPRTPFRDSNGQIVRKDRRRTPDRRLNNIQLREAFPLERPVPPPLSIRQRVQGSSEDSSSACED